MSELYPPITPHAHGMLPVAGGDVIYWETCGNPHGKSAVVLHGGPGSGCHMWHRRLFDPELYRVVLFDQRACGRSRPHASRPETSLTGNTTEQLTNDIEMLRRNLDIERWLVLGGSWGSTLALAYAQQFPTRVSELILFGVTTGRSEEFDWLFRDGLGAFFAEAWTRRRNAVPAAERDGDIVEAYCRLLAHPDPAVREHAALEWCMWESATPDWPPVAELASRFRDSSFAMAYARLVTHYVRHNAWLGDGRILRDAGKLADIPGILVNGRFDFQAPIATASTLHSLWPRSQLVIVNDAGHAADNPAITRQLVQATDYFARA